MSTANTADIDPAETPAASVSKTAANTNKSNNNHNNNNKNNKDSNKDSKSKLKNIDCYKRMNYLYQAAHLMMNPQTKVIDSTSEPVESIENQQQSTTQTQQQPPNQVLASFYCNVVHQISRRAVIRVNSSIKRTVCKGCSSLLIPGVSSTVRLKDNRETHVMIKCNQCDKVKRFQTNKNREKNARRKQKNKLDKERALAKESSSS
ncbi:hypothetical protein SAMD00019534_020870 [Acytostelium subglobosum LB1]|uniref:hypothetical protein n=1 Tax=Acytostelium subglobosum LB1 TaxID=1410327 RepID=UPI0006450D57|nr:hypothetical protein SAMD00019534_020870 [Acytostelium subglobosum LB1]GAM18912.1 hypothetical protein SAMD00019534_020870 [Acytostelium subglobosum LB1]|eukprot:XP_012758132.1 hypothetical protein SAMD00019534_020870 [Acytostelium subglobosum LB1]